MNALNNVKDKDKHVSQILNERGRVSGSLAKLKTIQRVYDSSANFILVRIKNAPKAYQHLVAAGIVVRDRSQVKLCEDCLRITIGTPLENDQLLTALASYE